LIPKAFNLSITSTFSINIVIAEADLVKNIIKNNRIVKTGSIVEEIIRIGYYRRLSSLITSYKIRIVVYYFYSIEILTKYINLNTITTTDEELYNFTTISVYIVINFNTEARYLIMTV
jgi:hypothetical protein